MENWWVAEVSDVCLFSFLICLLIILLWYILGKHVVIQKPQGAGSEYFAYKKLHSLNLMAVSDSRYRFIMVDIGQRGSESDGGVWGNCQFHESLQTGKRPIFKFLIFNFFDTYS